MNVASDQVRAFVFVTPDPHLVSVLAQVQSELRALPGGRQVRWTRPEQIHLTLRFLGNITSAEIGPVTERLLQVCRGVEPFTLQIAGLGCFPGPSRPRIVWLGLEGVGTTSLLKLQSAVAEALRSVGNHQDEKTFHPHLTIGRVGVEVRRLGFDWGSLSAAIRLRSWEVKSVQLMRSELAPTGARHSLIFEQPFANLPR